MNYEFHPEAEQEFLEAAARYEAEVGGLGERFGAQVYRVIELLLENPELGAPIEGQLRIRAQAFSVLDHLRGCF